MRKRLVDIDSAKGFAIFLVVLGHLDNYPYANEFYGILKEFIYKFHMPFFMYLSGIVFFYTYKPLLSINEYRRYVLKKIGRLAPGFIIFGTLILFGKILLQQFIHVENTSTDLVSDLFAILITPAQSVAGSLWFIYVLLEFYIIFPILIVIFRANILLLLIIGTMCQFLPGSSYFMIDQVLKYMLFFSIGIAAIYNYDKYKIIREQYRLILIILFLLSFSSMLVLNKEISKLIIGLFSLPALHSLFDTIIRKWRILLTLGLYTYPIYLMNLIVIGVAEGILRKYTDLDGSDFIYFAPLLLFLGIVGPIFIKKYVLSKNAYLDKITT